jgi:transcriptional regulator with XRE-family HTH domain
MTVEPMEKAQPLSSEELAFIIRELREMRQWSQDTLSAVSKLSIRTIQRVENGESSNGDTRRALALAFELEDIEIFNKPLSLPDPEQVLAEMEKFKREHLPLEGHVVSTGQELVRLFESAQMDSSSAGAALEGAASEAFAGLIDYLRDYRDCADCMSETEKLAVFKDVQGYLDALRKEGFTVSYARRDTKLVSQNSADKTPWAVTIIYLVASPKGSEPKLMLVPRQVTL